MVDAAELQESLKRMDRYFRQSQTIKNPNLLSEKLQKERPGAMISLLETWPTERDFAIYLYIEPAHRVIFLENLAEFNNMPISGKEAFLFWTPKFIGD